MNDELWQQWQAFSALMAGTPGATGMPPAGERPAPGFAPYLEAAERFATAARRFIDSSAAATAPAAPAVLEAARVFSDSLRDQFASFFQLPWNAGAAGAGLGAAPGGTFDQPALGLTREHQQRWQRMAEAWRALGQAQQRLQRLWSDVLREAAVAFVQQQAARPSAPGIEAVHALYDAWVDCAEAAYARMAHGNEFCDALADFINAGSHWRAAVMAGFEQAAKQFDLPTRSEINTLTQRLAHLEEQARTAPPPEPARAKAASPRAAKPSRKAAPAARGRRPRGKTKR
jgi:hypothetical protein